MMTLYKTSPRRSSQTNRPFNAGRCHRADFARQAAFEAFGPRAINHLSGPDFVDREPDSASSPDEIVGGRQAVTRWLILAANSEGEEAEIAYQTADELRQTLGLSWADVLGRKAA